MLNAEERKAEVFDPPEWVRPAVAACTAVSKVTSRTISSIDVVGTLRTGGSDKRLLLSLLERLAEEHDLEVTLDIEGNSFVARFSSAALQLRRTNA